MAFTSTPTLVTCDENSGFSLDRGEKHHLHANLTGCSTDEFDLCVILAIAVKETNTDLLQWQSHSTGSSVSLPLYIDDCATADTRATIEQVVVHVHGKGTPPTSFFPLV